MANLRVEKSGFWEVETTVGVEIVPYFVVPKTATLEDLQEHLEGKMLDDLDPQREDYGFVWRLEDAGFLSDNHWSASRSNKKAIEDAFALYEESVGFDIVFYDVLSCVAIALASDGWDALDDDEANQVEAFHDSVVAALGKGHWALMIESEDFKDCEVLGVWGETVTVAYVTKNDKSKGE